jgi:hypothetical protein
LGISAERVLTLLLARFKEERDAIFPQQFRLTKVFPCVPQ